MKIVPPKFVLEVKKMFEIKNGKLMMYDINKEYKDYLRKYDPKVSLKESRKFYGLLYSVYK